MVATGHDERLGVGLASPREGGCAVLAPGVGWVSAEHPDHAWQGVRDGYGACSKSGCNCQGFEGSGSTCANSGCGHAYSDHW